MRMLPPRYTKTVTVTSQDVEATITATYASAGVSKAQFREMLI